MKGLAQAVLFMLVSAPKERCGPRCVAHLAEVGPDEEADGPVEVGHVHLPQLLRQEAVSRPQALSAGGQELLTDPV